ncbi:hypothetical protein GCM10028857_26130 [Salinarchaeum chitinilyticum]
MAYSDCVEEYLEAGEYSGVGDKHSGTSDIRLARPAHKEEKIFRVECKNSKADLKASGFVTELARHLIDFNRGDEEFELLIFARELKNPPRWKDIFNDRIRKRDEVEWLWDKIQENHSLNDDEEEIFAEFELDHLWVFLEKVGVKKAEFGRLIELTEERKDKEKRRQKWEFYIRENKPVQERGNLTPNFFKISHYPEKIWVFPTGVSNPRKGYDREGIERYLPIWFEDSQLYTLVDPSEMPTSLKDIIVSERGDSHEFSDWMWQNDRTQHISKILLNKQLLWRGILRGDYSTVTPDSKKLIFRIRPVQTTLTDEASSGDRYRTKRDGYLMTRSVKGDVGHRYCRPMTRQYSDQHYVFLRTGWVFSKDGAGEEIISGKRAKELSDKLRNDGYDQVSNHRSQLNAWKTYLQIDQGEEVEHPAKVLDVSYPQRVELALPSNMELQVRPPKNSDERDTLMEGDRVA